MKARGGEQVVLFHTDPIGMHYNEATRLTNNNGFKSNTTTVCRSVRASASVRIIKDRGPY